MKFRRSADAVLTVKAKAATPDGAVGTLDAAITHVREQLDAQQAAAGAPLGSFMQIETLAHSDHAQPLEGNPFRAVGAIVLVGVLVMVAVTVALDAIAPHGFRRMGARIRRTFRAGVGRLTVPQHADTGASKGPLEPPPAPAPAPPSTPVGANGNREARRRAAREGRGSGPPPRTPRGGDRSQTPSRPS